MGRYRVTRRAELDFDEIWLYIATDSPKHADLIIDTLHEKCSFLADFPTVGTLSDYAPGLLQFSVGNYVIFYRTIPGSVEIARVIHGARDIPAVLGKR